VWEGGDACVCGGGGGDVCVCVGGWGGRAGVSLGVGFRVYVLEFRV